MKQKLIDWLSNKGIPPENYRIRFYEKSPYQKRRYKPEFVKWEAWIYSKEIYKTPKIFRDGMYHRDRNGDLVTESEIGLLITADDFEENKEEIFDCHLRKFVK